MKKNRETISHQVRWKKQSPLKKCLQNSHPRVHASFLKLLCLNLVCEKLWLCLTVAALTVEKMHRFKNLEQQGDSREHASNHRRLCEASFSLPSATHIQVTTYIKKICKFFINSCLRLPCSKLSLWRVATYIFTTVFRHYVPDKNLLSLFIKALSHALIKS